MIKVLAIIDSARLSLLKTALSDVGVHLFKNDIIPDPAAPLAQFTEADFTGYGAGSNITPTGPVLDTDGEWKLIVPTLPFVCTGGASQTVYGYYLTFDGDATYWIAERFDAPIGMATSRSLLMTPEIKQGALDGTANPPQQ